MKGARPAPRLEEGRPASIDDVTGCKFSSLRLIVLSATRQSSRMSKVGFFLIGEKSISGEIIHCHDLRHRFLLSGHAPALDVGDETGKVFATRQS